MYFEQFYLGCLSHASYMVGSAGIAAVIDPRRDVGIYLEEAHNHDLRIQYVIETHLHADFVSGHHALAQLTNAKIYVGHRAGATFPHIPVHDGDELRFGNVLLRFLETPGHTLESISIVITDLETSSDPVAVLTGDTLFIGDVGRPDLSGDLTPQQLAGMLYDSLHSKLLTLPDNVQVYPAHGAGSLCGRHMSSERSSTIGKERISNYALRATNKDDFVQLLTSELPERPGYFAADVEINRAGAPPLEELPPIVPLRPGEVITRKDEGAVLLDTRSTSDFGAAHVPGSLQIGLAGQFASWAGILLGVNAEIILIAEDDAAAQESRMRLARVGIENVTGYLANGIAGWIQEALPVAQITQVSVEDLHRIANADPESNLQILDVRRPVEWEHGHLENAVLKPLDKLESLLGELNLMRPVAVYCKGGYRSSIASSILQRAGFIEVINVTGGFDAWRACNLPFTGADSRSAKFA
jgi:glyoxylase-like metal-dependent hydrolase (beta-lactamase superfamily II)/rhodanese-related sulfurtransferase